MIKILILSLLLFILTGCELITIGVQKTEKPIVININQKTAEGVLMVLKTELDSNNIWGAAQVLAKKGGDKLSAEERYYMHYDILRVKRIFGNHPFSIIKSDTLDKNIINLQVEINYYKKYSLKAEKVNNIWYLIDLGLNDNQ